MPKSRSGLPLASSIHLRPRIAQQWSQKTVHRAIGQEATISRPSVRAGQRIVARKESRVEHSATRKGSLSCLSDTLLSYYFVVVVIVVVATHFPQPSRSSAPLRRVYVPEPSLVQLAEDRNKEDQKDCCSTSTASARVGGLAELKRRDYCHIAVALVSITTTTRYEHVLEQSLRRVPTHLPLVVPACKLLACLQVACLLAGLRTFLPKSIPIVLIGPRVADLECVFSPGYSTHSSASYSSISSHTPVQCLCRCALLPSPRTPDFIL